MSLEEHLRKTLKTGIILDISVYNKYEEGVVVLFLINAYNY